MGQAGMEWDRAIQDGTGRYGTEQDGVEWDRVVGDERRW